MKAFWSLNITYVELEGSRRSLRNCIQPVQFEDLRTYTHWISKDKNSLILGSNAPPVSLLGGVGGRRPGSNPNSKFAWFTRPLLDGRKPHPPAKAPLHREELLLLEALDA